jgi:hypothetical protein
MSCASTASPSSAAAELRHGKFQGMTLDTVEAEVTDEVAAPATD